MFPTLHHELNGEGFFKILFGRDQVNPLDYRLVDYHTFSDRKLRDILLSAEYEIMRIADDDGLPDILGKKDVCDALKYIRDKVVLTMHMRRFLPCLYELLDLPIFRRRGRNPRMPKWIIDSNRKWTACKLFLLPHTNFMRFSTGLDGLPWEEISGRNVGCSDGRNYTHRNIRLQYAERELEEQKKCSTNFNKRPKYDVK